MIKSVRNFTSTQKIWSIYFTYFVIWPEGEGKSVKIFQLQKRVIHLLTGVHKLESCRHMFRKFQILSLASLYILEMLCFVKQYQGNLQQNFALHGHNTRNKFDLRTRYCSSVLYKRSVINMGIKLFNKLPIQIKQLDNRNGFKRKAKNFLLHN
jgi:hypothetical protein